MQSQFDTLVEMKIFIGESDSYEHHPLFSEIVRRAFSLGIRGATVLRGFEGFGMHRSIHHAKLLSLSDDLPVLIIVIDTEERIDTLTREIAPIIQDGLMTKHYVEAKTFRASR